MAQTTIKKRFRESIKCGTGEAFILLRENPDIGFSKYIKKAALKNYAYDPQCEGDRANYVVRLINNCSKKEELIEEVLKALSKRQKDFWALDQLFELAAIFANNGNKKARKKIYKRYHEKLFDKSTCGERTIIKLDGFKGLKFIVERRGRALGEDADDWEDSYLLDNFQEENPEIKVYKELNKLARKNKFIKKYLDEIEKNKRLRSQRPKRPHYTYESIKENIENKKIIPAPSNVIKNLKGKDIEKLANDFLKETDPDKQEKYLRIFSQIKYPINYYPILKIAKGKNWKNNRLVEYACESLRFFKGKDIREIAIKKISKTKKPADYLDLLVANYKKGDSKLLSKIAKKTKNQHVLHHLIFGYVDIYKKNKTKECKKPLETMYSKLTCGMCPY